jgi:hypothetical protein
VDYIKNTLPRNSFWCAKIYFDIVNYETVELKLFQCGINGLTFLADMRAIIGKKKSFYNYLKSQ